MKGPHELLWLLKSRQVLHLYTAGGLPVLAGHQEQICCLSSGQGPAEAWLLIEGDDDLVVAATCAEVLLGAMIKRLPARELSRVVAQHRYAALFPNGSSLEWVTWAA